MVFRGVGWSVAGGMTAQCVVVIPAGAGMAYINHWIPACAGMTTERIPAFAEMTVKAINTSDYSLNSIACILLFDLPRPQARITGLFMPCRSF